jgi:hypothetical protein
LHSGSARTPAVAAAAKARPVAPPAKGPRR